MAKKRPAEEKAASGEEPVRVPVTYRIFEYHKERIKALATVRDQNEYQVVEDALETYWNSLPDEDRADAESLADMKRRRQSKNQPTSRP